MREVASTVVVTCAGKAVRGASCVEGGRGSKVQDPQEWVADGQGCLGRESRRDRSKRSWEVETKKAGCR